MCSTQKIKLAPAARCQCVHMLAALQPAWYEAENEVCHLHVPYPEEAPSTCSTMPVCPDRVRRGAASRSASQTLACFSTAHVASSLRSALYATPCASIGSGLGKPKVSTYALSASRCCCSVSPVADFAGRQRAWRVYPSAWLRINYRLTWQQAGTCRGVSCASGMDSRSLNVRRHHTRSCRSWQAVASRLSLSTITAAMRALCSAAQPDHNLR